MTGTIDLMLKALDVGLDRRKVLYTLLWTLLTFVVFGSLATPALWLLSEQPIGPCSSPAQ